MATLELSSLAHVTNTTRTAYNKGRYTALWTDIQEFPAAKRILGMMATDGKAGHRSLHEVLTGSDRSTMVGSKCEWMVSLGTSSAARTVGSWQTDAITDISNETQANVPWRSIDTHWAWDVDEVNANGINTDTRLHDLLKYKRDKARFDLVNKIEENFWGFPASTDTKSWYGLMYWMVRSGSARGFNGTAQSGYSTVANINPTTYSRWRNYTFPYTDIADNDLLEELRHAFIDCGFENPVNAPTTGELNQWELMTTKGVHLGIDRIMRANNDRLGTDLDWQAGRGRFGGVAYQHVPYLTNNTSTTSDPGYSGSIYGINWGDMKIKMLRGADFVEREARAAPNQHKVMVAWIDATGNFVQQDRRRHFVGSTAA